MRRGRAGISALVFAAFIAVPVSTALAAFAPHESCVALRHDCGRTPQIASCCCRHAGSTFEANGLAPGRHRDLSSRDAASPAVASTAAEVRDASPVSPLRARSEDRPIRFGNLRI